VKKVFYTSKADETVALGRKIGSCLKGGEVIELSSDLGGGKTTLVKGIVAGFGSEDSVSSPSFTISNRYERGDGKAFVHYDFYRLHEPGIMAAELQETSSGDDVIAVEWANIVKGVLPAERIQMTIKSTAENEREITVELPEKLTYVLAEEE